MQQVQKIKLSKIEYSPTNPRKTFDDTKLRELAGSMAAIGLINPIKVRPRGNAFELVAGERRVRAAELSEWTEIDAIVEDMDDVQVLEAQLAENSQREDVHPIEEAEVYLALHRDHAYSTEQIQAGYRLYASQCQLCHAVNGDGVAGISLSRQQFRSIANDEDIYLEICSQDHDYYPEYEYGD